MVDWQSGHYMSTADAWRFFDGTLEIMVVGTPVAPNSHWLSVAKDVMSSLIRYQYGAGVYLDAFVDRARFASEANWELEFIEFGMPCELAGVRFVLYFRIVGDEYGLWSVAFHATGMAPPHDLYPVRIQRQQQ